ncbi:unnamed protein product [Prorocentrum cordatum]|uniref:Uncharacterized protein n=1 Tax=Prorocentrum cordatum TaxID=2364126 RepID=A0ABN9RUQ5_9DINO|nr:unnamed protein product [Polarella glacialis]
MAVLEVLVAQQVVQDSLLLRAEYQGLKGLDQRINGENMDTAAECIEYWRAETTFAKAGDEIRVRHSFYIHAFVPIGEPTNMLIVPANLLISKLLTPVGSEIKPGPPPRATTERKLQNSLDKMLKGRSHHMRH